MLESLHIQNYALISSLHIQFGKGLTTVTGETGAGKSILLGALSLILGQRAESEVLQDPSLKCMVEGSFRLNQSGLKGFFEKYDLDYQEITTLRREINPNGKSRAFINDTPVNLSVLRELGLQLVDIHSQHENLDLGSRIFQLRILDLMAGNQNLLLDYQRKFREYKELQLQYNQLVEDLNKSRSDLDYYSFQYQQLAEARLKENEETELTLEQKTLSHAGELQGNLSRVAEMLGGEGASVVQLIRDALALLSRSESYLTRAGDLHDRLQSTYIEIRDIAEEAERIALQTEIDPDRLHQVESRIDLLFSLLQKHRVQTVLELMQIRDNLKSRIDNIARSDERIGILEKEIQAAEKELEKIAGSLSDRRKKVIPQMEKKITAQLTEMGIPHARFVVLCEDTGDFTLHGRDQAGFLFSANKQSDLQELSKVASGGEISRLMLSLKSLMAESVSVPTIIFDEIDAGVSGEIAHRMGSLIETMSKHLQVINITHLPQIAARGENHLLVYKKDQKEATHTHVRVLKTEERIHEIARMLSGNSVSEAALSNARELMGMN